MAYVKCKDLTKRTQSDNVLRDRTFTIDSNPKYNGFLVFFDKNKSTRSGIKFMSNLVQLANKLHKPIIKKFKRRRVYRLFKNNI